ncbi:hypothetical protein TRFO_38904 [Tritrichomonas foetus]|uniref:Clan SC, family S28, unassigned serine peptidase n=1 Tax=Tritrichomonas foetus TaxID=1144522 RepID=A0A1J4J8B2_9EUKA|nr:hypothetical protein TRFO_38904 [Tritrichomonas foetus]|eukprot:OHS94929.1 hypothetical protein TRFO_38904 [Tritrichomonas foetus]
MFLFLFFLQLIQSKIIRLAFEQTLDHFNYTSPITFNQSYIIDYTYNKNPNETKTYVVEMPELWTLSESFSKSAIRLANLTNSILIKIEHRFFGNSTNTTDYSTTNLKYLTISQTLADITAILNYYNSSIEKAIVMGSGYPGSLASWMRMKYPQFVTGAWASYSPLLSTENNSEYFRKLFEKTNNICTNNSKVENVIQSISEKLSGSESEINQIYELFHFNETTKPSKALYVITEILSMMYSDNSYVKYCNSINSIEDYASAIQKYIQSLRDQRKFAISDINPQNLTNRVNLTVQQRNFRAIWYLKCTELGQFHFHLNKSFPKLKLNLDKQFYLDTCKELFKFRDLGDYEMINTEFGDRSPKTSNVVYTVDESDPDYSLMVVDGTVNDEIYIKKIMDSISPSQDIYFNIKNGTTEITELNDDLNYLLKRWMKDECLNTCVNGKCIAHFCICNDGWCGENCTDRYYSAKKFKAIASFGTVVPTIVLLIAACMAYVTIWRGPNVNYRGY